MNDSFPTQRLQLGGVEPHLAPGLGAHASGLGAQLGLPLAPQGTGVGQLHGGWQAQQRLTHLRPP